MVGGGGCWLWLVIQKGKELKQIFIGLALLKLLFPCTT